MSNILVTGGAGYIGSHTCKALAKSGFTPIAYDNLANGHKWAVKWGPLEIGNISDKDKLSIVLKKYKPEAVIHFAAFAYVGESIIHPAKYYKNNLSGTLNLIETLLDNNINKIIFSSTCATYGVPKEDLITEQHPQNPINPYGQSKLMVEEILKDFDIAYGIRHVSLRYFNAAGADLDGEIGESHDPETHLIPLAIYTAMGLRDSLDVYGNDYPTPDGTAIRDYIHVSDLADAHLQALKYLLAGNGSISLNLGNGNGHSVRDVVLAVESISNKNVAVNKCGRRRGDPASLIASSKKAVEILGWTPRYASLKEIINTAWKWHLCR